MAIVEEFKKFALKGNVIDLAVAVIIGAAFGKIISSLVDNILMPPLGMLLGDVDFSHLRIVLKPAMDAQPEVFIGYGIFLQHIINFLLVAWAMFFVVKTMNRLSQKPAPPGATPEDVLLLREIRDALKKSLTP